LSITIDEVKKKEEISTKEVHDKYNLQMEDPVEKWEERL